MCACMCVYVFVCLIYMRVHLSLCVHYEFSSSALGKQNFLDKRPLLTNAYMHIFKYFICYCFLREKKKKNSVCVCVRGGERVRGRERGREREREFVEQ